MENKAATFKVFKDGPLKIEGDFIINDTNGKELSTGKHVYLCRCNKSSNYPFCDGSHKKSGE